MSSQEIKQKFLDFFEKKGHKIVPSSPLTSDDPTVLFTTAGMQQFKRYYTGELNALSDFGSRRTASCQKCFRTSDIDSVGDKSHLTFFEMLGNFSFGPVGSDKPDDFGEDGYFKRSAIHWAYEFLTQILKIESERISVTVFQGDETVPPDEESLRIWTEEIGLPQNKIKTSGREDNFWGPTGNEGPCGPTSEIYIDGIEIWNLVFNEYYQEKNGLPAGGLRKLEKPGVDTGMGLERLTMIIQNVPTIFETDLFLPIIHFLNENISKDIPEWSKRIIADHARAIVFLIADGLSPSNKDAGYILRRLIRRTISHLIEFQLFDEIKPGEKVKLSHYDDALEIIIKEVVRQYNQSYNYLIKNEEKILRIVKEESKRYLLIKEKGEEILEKLIQEAIDNNSFSISGKDIFDLITTHGFSLEWIKDFAGKIHGINLDLIGFEEIFEKHQEISRAGAEKKFGGHSIEEISDEKEKLKATKLHTATHLLHQALRNLLGNEVKQMGSDITPERLRFDFSFSRKLTDKELKQIEAAVNQKIQENLPVSCQEMSKEEAEKTGALHFFKEKYPDKVKIYSINNYSKEFCGGPHIQNTSEIGRFKIIKEESAGAGVRRIRAMIE